MHTREIAKLAYVYLENLGAPTPKGDRVLRKSLREAIRPLLPDNDFLSMRFDHLPPLTAHLMPAKSAMQGRSAFLDVW